MAIDIQNESLLQLKDVPSWTESNLGNRIHPSTVHRWRLRGSRGVKLETLLAGGVRYTSHEALMRFFTGATVAADSPTNSSASSKSVADAEDYLAKEGL